MGSPETVASAAPAPPQATTGEPVPAGTARGVCQRCGFAVPRRVMGCKNPCRNCGTVYPFGDCSD